MSVNWTYCIVSSHFTIYISQIIMLYIFNLYTLYVNNISIKLGDTCLHCLFFFPMGWSKWYHCADSTETVISWCLITHRTKNKLLYFICRALHYLAIPTCDATTFPSLNSPNRSCCNLGKPNSFPPKGLFSCLCLNCCSLSLPWVAPRLH